MSAKSGRGRRVRVVALGALLLALGIAGGAAAFLPEQLEVRRAIELLGGADAQARRSVERLRDVPPRALRPQLGWLVAGLDGWSARLRANKRASTDARMVCDLLVRAARVSPQAVADALARPSLEPIAYRALLRSGLPALACPLPRGATLSPWRRTAAHLEEGALSFEWGVSDPALAEDEYDVVFPVRYDASLCIALWPGGAGAIADLGDVPLEAAAPPPPGDPRWIRVAADAASPAPPDALAGHTYAVEVDRPRIALRAVLRLDEVSPYDRVRLRWRLISVERLRD